MIGENCDSDDDCEEDEEEEVRVSAPPATISKAVTPAKAEGTIDQEPKVNEFLSELRIEEQQEKSDGKDKAATEAEALSQGESRNSQHSSASGKKGSSPPGSSKAKKSFYQTCTLSPAARAAIAAFFSPPKSPNAAASIASPSAKEQEDPVLPAEAGTEEAMGVAATEEVLVAKAGESAVEELPLAEPYCNQEAKP